MNFLRQFGFALSIACTLTSGFVHAQDISAPIEQEVRQRLRVETNINPLGENPFGESVNLYNGALSFEQTDIDLEGIGPDIKVTRSYEAWDTTAPWWREFADWRMEIPHIETITTPSDTGYFISPPTGRCSGIPANPAPTEIAIPNQLGGPAVIIDAQGWWYGMHLDIPGAGAQDPILPGAQNTRPLPLVTTYSGQKVQATITTRSNWAIGCLASTSNGAPGEGFLAIAPDGTQYFLDRLIYKRMEDYGTEPYNIQRNLAMMMVSRVVDRFGNSLTYNYDANNNLTSIVASDGRSVAFTYTNFTIASQTNLTNPDPGYRVNAATVTASNGTTRTWMYSYESSVFGSLSGVSLPNGSGWSFSLDDLRMFDDPIDPTLINYVNAGPCTPTLEPQNAKTLSGTMTHPSGLSGTFTVESILHGESYVPYVCVGQVSGDYLGYRNVLSTPTLIQKSFSGAGIPSNETWTYGYSSPNYSWNTDSCAANNSCLTTVYTDVTDPNGNDVRYTFSNRFDATESELLDTQTYQGAAGSTLLRDVQTSYASPSTGPWPSSLGLPLGGGMNGVEVTSLVPLNQKLTLQSGDTYTWQSLAFDIWANPTDTKRSSSIAGQSSIEETHGYLYDTNQWVMGLPVATTNVGTSEVESSFTYNANDLLASRSSFGQLLMSYTYDSAGDLASYSDGNGHTISFSNYYRGIPQNISYPDGASESAVVDDFGEVTSRTTPRGNTTSYSYDSIGRVVQINYPTNDTVSWNPEVISYSFVNSAEQGIAAGHWDRVDSIGTKQSTTYFDADLRPLLIYTLDTGLASSDSSIAFAYDWTGAKTFTSVPGTGMPTYSELTVGIHNTYDALERLTQSQQDSELGTLTTATSYLQGAGRQVTDPNGNTTTTYYQVFDEPEYVAPVIVNAPQGVTQTIVRDVYGNPTSITQAGAYGSENDSVTKSILYDSYHRSCLVTEPESGSTVYSYDAANNVVWTAQGQNITDGTCGQSDVPTSAQTVRTFDPMNRVLTITPPTGTQSTTYTYDADGNLSTSASGITNQAFSYNTRDMMTSEVLAVPGYTWAMAYNYDSNGHLSAIGYPNTDGTSEGVAYSPDALGRPSQAGSYATGVDYFADGKLAGFQFGNGTLYTSLLNSRELPNDFSYFTSSTVNIAEQLTYDNNGNITGVADTVNGQRSKSFTVDGLNRLTSATATQLYGTESYSYDAINNLRSRLTSGNTLTYNYDSNNHLASVTEGASVINQYDYDTQGNRNSLTSGGSTTQFTFDAANQLLQVSGVEGYAYDAAGRRVAKISPSGTPAAYYFYSHGGQLIYSFDATSLLATNYIYLDGKLIAKHAYAGLEPPSALSFSSNPNGGSFSVSWPSVTGATSYTLQETSAGSNTFTTVYSGSSTSASVSGLAMGSYSFAVNACVSSGCSSWYISPTILNVWPPIPSISVPSGTQNGPYTVSWTGNSSGCGSCGYILQESLNGGAWNTVVSGTYDTSFSRPGNVTGSYTYQVEATMSGITAGWSATSAPVVVNTNFGVTPTPSPTLTVPATSNTGSPTLSWTSSSPVTNYTVQVNTSSGIPDWITVYSGTSTSFTASGLGDATYAYQVQACNTAGGGTACTAWVAGSNSLVVALPPVAPTLSSPTGTVTAMPYSVTWSAVSTATSYNLQQQVNGGAWATIQSSSARSWSASGESNGTYSYRVQACYDGVCGAWSSASNVVVAIPPSAAPTISGAGTSSSGSFTLSWNTVPTATYYVLDYFVSSTQIQQIQDSSATSWTGNLSTSGSYNYAVEACNAGGCGPLSGTVTETVTLAPTGVPVLTTPKGIVTSTYTVTWSSVSGATSYNLQQQENGGAWKTVATGPVSTFTAFDESAGTWGYHAQACNGSACGGWSATSNVIVSSNPGD